MHVDVPRPGDRTRCLRDRRAIGWSAHGGCRRGCGKVHTERAHIPLLAEVRVQLRVARDPPGVVAVRQPQIIGDGAGAIGTDH